MAMPTGPKTERTLTTRAARTATRIAQRRDRAGDALAAVAERDPGGEADQHDAGDEREHAGHVVGRRHAVGEDVMHVAAAVDRGERRRT